MKSIEIEIFDQTNIILASIKKEKKSDVQKIIDDLSFCSVKYSFIRVLFRNLKFSEMLQSQQQSRFLFFSFSFSLIFFK
jgi:hypothetical protein